MHGVFFYIDPRGRRSGPYTEAELCSLAGRGLLERRGQVELEGTAIRWTADEIGWLRDTFPKNLAVDEGERVPSPGSPPLPPPDMIDEGWTSSADRGGDIPEPLPPRSAPAETTRTTIGPTTNTGLGNAAQPLATTRTVFVLLALLPSFIGLFGIHNIVAGYLGRGITQLVLSVLTLGGCCATIWAPPCLCLGLPMWFVLFVWSVIEAATVTTDARGRLMT